MEIAMTEQEFKSLQEDAARYRVLREALQQSYDDGLLESSDLSTNLDCSMVFGRGGYRRMQVKISFADKRDEPVNFDAILDKIIAGDKLARR